MDALYARLYQLALAAVVRYIQPHSCIEENHASESASHYYHRKAYNADSVDMWGGWMTKTRSSSAKVYEYVYSKARQEHVNVTISCVLHGNTQEFKFIELVVERSTLRIIRRYYKHVISSDGCIRCRYCVDSVNNIPLWQRRLWQELLARIGPLV